MRLNFIQSLIIVAMVALATQITRWTPFLVFSGSRKLPRVVEDLGRLLPPAMMGLLVVYSLRNTDILSGSHGRTVQRKGRPSGRPFSYFSASPRRLRANHVRGGTLWTSND